MKEQTQSAIKLLEALTERAKELTCLYAIEEALREPDADVDHVCNGIIRAIPPGWQFPEICVAKIVLEGREFQSDGFEETPWKLTADIMQQDQVVGTIGVYYTKEMHEAEIGPFLKEEKKLIETIAERFDHFLTYKRMKHLFQEWRSTDRDLPANGRADWEAVVDLIRQTDNALFLRISNKMLNHLCWSGIEEAEKLRRTEGYPEINGHGEKAEDITGPRLSRLLDFSTESTERIFWIAANNLSREEILARVQMWIQEDKLGALLRTVRTRLPLSDISSSLRRYFFTTRDETYARYPLARGLKVLLIESILSNRVDYIEMAKDHLAIEDLYHLLQRVIFSPESHGTLGAKSAGLFLSSRALEIEEGGSSSPFSIPKTWYISSDMMLEFIHYNNMDEIIEQKYKDIERVRLEYPHVIDMFRETVFPPAMVGGLSAALDDFGETPIVVRASSLLEDRTGEPFAGRYKTVFLSNCGGRERRLRDLLRAVAEVYASNFGPDPIAFRAKRGLLEFSEQMGVILQEVVGSRVGSYFLPAYSGVARSRGDFRGVPGLAAETGVARLVPGLGTRLRAGSGDGRSILILPGQASGPTEHSARLAPRSVDAINLETNRVESVDLGALMESSGCEYPNAELIMSLDVNGRVQPLDLEDDGAKITSGALVATFEGLVERSPFVAGLRNTLRTFEEKLGVPVEIEFASDGENLYLLQCRIRPLVRAVAPVPFPKDLPQDRLIFSTHHQVPNGRASNITHIVYVDPAAYAAVDDPTRRRDVRESLSRLNMLLPRRQFALILPEGLRSSDGEYAKLDIAPNDVDNAAVMVDLIAEETCDVHSALNIVESGVFYLALCMNDDANQLNRQFLEGSDNMLESLLPEYGHLSNTLRVIDIQAAVGGGMMRVLMNSELGRAVGVLVDSGQELEVAEGATVFENGDPENYWRWRHGVAEQIARRLDPDRFGVHGVYLFGSTNNGTAGPTSDINLILHFRGDDSQREKLTEWLEGWSLCLDEINYLRTGYRSGGLLDVHIVTDEDIANNTGYAAKINAVTNAARPLQLGHMDHGAQSSPGQKAL